MEKKVVLYILSSPTVHGGANKSFLNMLEGVIDSGITPVIILPCSGAMTAYLDSREIKYYVIKYFFSIYPRIKYKKDFFKYLPLLCRTILFNFFAQTKIEKIVKTLDPLLIHTNVGPVHVGFEVAKKNKIPHIWHLREYQLLDFDMAPLWRGFKSFRKKLNDDCNYSIAITKGIADFFSLNPKRSQVIYNGILKEPEINFIKEKEEYFLFAGRLEEKKGIYTLMEVFLKFSILNQKYKLYVAGDTADLKYQNKLTGFIKKNKLHDRIILLGMRDDIHQLMAKATALIVPSVSEGFGRITAEALFNGCLVLGYNNAGTSEILSTINPGFLYNNNDELLAKMSKIADEGIENYFPAILSAQEKAVKLYSQEQNISNTLSFYHKVLNIHS